MRLFPCRLASEDRGAAVVEFALVLPILMLIVFMIIDGTRAFYTVNNLVSAAREGARFGSVVDLPCPITEAAKTPIKDRVLAASRSFGGADLTAAQVQVFFNGCAEVKVRINDYPFRPLTPIAGTVGADSVLISREVVFRWERAP